MKSTLPGFLARRILRAAVLMVVVSSVALTLVHFAGDPFENDPTIPDAVVRVERARYGLDRPFLQQYLSWLRRAVTLDLGESILYRRPVTGLLAERLPRTVLLGVTALVLAVALGIPLGVLGGARPERWWARATRAASMVLVSVPPLVLSLALLLLAARTGWLPAGGLAVTADASFLRTVAEMARSLALPAIALGLPIAASIERLQAGALSDAMHEPCVRAALARGVSVRRAVWNHAFRLSLKPVLAIFGIIVGSVLSGSLIVEIVMSWPGIGRLMYDALMARDVYLAGGCAAAASVFLALGVLLSDLGLAAVDPRVRELE